MDKSGNAPIMVKCDIRPYKWHNTSELHDQRLIADKYIEIIDESLDKAQEIINSFTFSLANKSNKYLAISHLTDNYSDIRRAKSIVENAVRVLRQNWDEVLLDAQERLGNLFDKSEYPDPKLLSELYGLNCEIFFEGGTITTLEIYQRYSLHHVDPPAPDLFEVVEWANAIESKRNRNKED